MPLKASSRLHLRQEARVLVRSGLSQSEVARRLGVARKTVNQWCRLPEKAVEMVRKPGCRPRLEPWQREEAAYLLLYKPCEYATIPGDIWTLPRFRILIRSYVKVHPYSDSHLYLLWRQLRAEGPLLPHKTLPKPSWCRR